MKELRELREKAREELKTLNKNQELDAKEWSVVHELVGTIEKIDKVCGMREEDRQGDDYGHGSSYADRLHYGRDGRRMPMDDGLSARRDRRVHYSRADGREEMMSILDRAWDAATPAERERFSRFLADM